LNAEAIHDALDKNRERLLVAIEPLPDEALVEPGVMGEWSVADILVHLTVWESELVTALMRVDQGKKPSRLLEAYSDIDDYNARRYIENKDRDLDRIFADLQGVRLQLEQWLEEFGESLLADPKLFEWSQGRTLWQIIEDNSFGHEAEHLPDIEAFASKWQSGQARELI
jgi:hypothetical protein